MKCFITVEYLKPDPELHTTLWAAHLALLVVSDAKFANKTIVLCPPRLTSYAFCQVAVAGAVMPSACTLARCVVMVDPEALSVRSGHPPHF